MGWREAEAAKYAAMVRTEASIENGVARWRSNGAVPPHDVLAAAVAGGVEGISLLACAWERSAEAAAFVAEYVEKQPSEPSAEERAEARAAFGEGVEVVDAISGRRFRT